MRLSLISALAFLIATAAQAQTIYPIDRAEILTGARFDLKVEFPSKISPQQASVTVNGAGIGAVFGGAAEFVEREDGKDQSSIVMRDVTLPQPGTYTVTLACCGEILLGNST